MPKARDWRLMLGAPAAIIVALAGVGAFLEASLGGPGTTAFVVRLLLVSVAVVAAALLGLTLRMPLSGTEAGHLASPLPPHDER